MRERSTVSAGQFYMLLLRMGTKRSFVDGGLLRCVGRQGKREPPIAEAEVEPLFAWSPAPSIDWRSPRVAPPPANMPVPAEEDDASALAVAAARSIGALSVYVEAQPDGGALFHAVVSFRRTSTESPDARDKAARAFVRTVLAKSADAISADFVRQGSAVARSAAARVSELAALVRAVASCYVDDLPLGGELEGLAERIDTWSLRASVPTDEALGVAAQLGGEAAKLRR
jgi:hypothetical protein